MTTPQSAGEISVRVVLFRDDGGEAVPVCGTHLDSSAVLVAPVNVPREVVHRLLNTPVPAQFAADPWLNEHRSLTFTDGRCRVGAHELRYHEKFGVYVDEES